MSDIDTTNELISLQTTSDHVYVWEFEKYPQVVTTAGQTYTLWNVDGAPGTGGTSTAGSGTPGAGGTTRSSANGGMTFPDQSPATKRLIIFEGFTRCTSGIFPTITLYDRIVDVGPPALTSVANVNCNTVALGRYTSGVGLECWIEVTSATSTTAPIVDLRYTNSSGTSGRQSPNVTFPLAATSNRTILPITLQAGDVGLQSIQTLNVSTASGGGSAACNLVIVKRLASLPVNAEGGLSPRDMGRNIGEAYPIIYDGATLALTYTISSTTSMFSFSGRVGVTYG